VTDGDPDLAGALAARLDLAAHAHLGRSLALFHAEAADCGGCTLELRALRGVAYRLQRLGLTLVDTPRHADVLLITGAATRTIADPLRRTWEAMADPKWVIAIGNCALDGGPFRGSYAVLGGAPDVMPVDAVVPGCPPTPAAVLAVLTALLEANA
jgi:Ni,Fe-hydrogenase III small subunit